MRLPAAIFVLTGPRSGVEHLDVDVLHPSSTGTVCLTCQHFRCEDGS